VTTIHPFGYYRTLMTKDEAERIFSLTPEAALKAIYLPLPCPS
jgi:hypothetical protein